MAGSFSEPLTLVQSDTGRMALTPAGPVPRVSSRTGEEGEHVSHPLLWRQEGETVWVQVAGRARYDLAHALRDFLSSPRHRTVVSLRLDLGACESMDSTFMGVLAMLGSRADGPSVVLVNAGPKLRGQLAQLGIAHLFAFESTQVATQGWVPLPVAGAMAGPAIQSTVRDAHVALGDVDPANRARFRGVLDALE